MKDAPLLNLVLALMLVLLIGVFLVIGRTILVPIVTAVISVYLMASATEGLRQLPGLRVLPRSVLRVCVLIVFGAVVYVLAVVVAATVRDIAAVAPDYQQNIEALLTRIEAQFDVDTRALIDDARRDLGEGGADAVRPAGAQHREAAIGPFDRHWRHHGREARVRRPFMPIAGVQILFAEHVVGDEACIWNNVASRFARAVGQADHHAIGVDDAEVGCVARAKWFCWGESRPFSTQILLDLARIATNGIIMQERDDRCSQFLSRLT